MTRVPFCELQLTSTQDPVRNDNDCALLLAVVFVANESDGAQLCAHLFGGGVLRLAHHYSVGRGAYGRQKSACAP